MEKKKNKDTDFVATTEILEKTEEEKKKKIFESASDKIQEA